MVMMWDPKPPTDLEDLEPGGGVQTGLHRASKATKVH